MTASSLADTHHIKTSNELASPNGTEQHMNTQNSQRRTRRVVAAIAALGLVALGSACSGQDLAESIAENQIENETGENIDLDFTDGGVAIQTEDGSMTVDADGNMVIESPEGSIVANVDGDGNVQMTGDDGQTVNINTEAGGDYQASSEDGQFTASSGGEVPDEFPSDIVIPVGFEVTTSSVMGDSETQIVSMTMTSASSVPDTVAALSGSLQAAGYTQESETTAGDSVFAAHSKGESQVVTTYNLDSDGDTVVGISVQT